MFPRQRRPRHDPFRRGVHWQQRVKQAPSHHRHYRWESRPQKEKWVWLRQPETPEEMLQVCVIRTNLSYLYGGSRYCNNYSNVWPCFRYHYYVRFAELGMDWILAPEGYDAYYCSGDCPFMYLSEQKSSLYYTFVIARANYNNPMASPRPCCTPAALSALSIMYSSGQVDAAVCWFTLFVFQDRFE